MSFFIQNLDNIKNKNIFISGGSGIIGKELVKKLISLGANIAVGDLQKCPAEFLKKIKYIKKDLNYLKFSEIKNFKPEIFIHLAATYERTVESKNFFSNNFHNNIRLSNHLLSIFCKFKTLKKIIFASSYLVYSPNLYLSRKAKKPFSLNENSEIYPRNLIAASKLYHESELKFISNFKPDLSIICARIFRGYGLNSRDVISRWVRDLSKKKPIKVYSEKSSFDFIFSKDSAQALINMIKIKDRFSIINVGYGRSIKISTVLKTLNSYFKNLKKKNILFSTQVENSLANINILKSKTKFRPQYSFEKSLEEIISYEKKKI
jgi:carbamoyl-phosphate synthase large subunit